jgi:hypothetical protein
MAVPLINGQSYNYTQITINILGAPVFGVSAINYTAEQDKTNEYGQGENPVARGRGAKTYSGSIDLHMNEIENIRAVVASRDMLDIPAFDIVIVFGNTQKVVVHTLKDVEFTSNPNEMAQGDTNITSSMNIIFSHIIYSL